MKIASSQGYMMYSMPPLLYEALPFIYLVSGIAARIVLGPLAMFSSVILFLAASIVSYMRYSSRHKED